MSAAARASMALLTVFFVLIAVGVLVAPAASAEISQVTPAQGGELEPGETTTFSVTTDATCIRAAGDSLTYVVGAEVAGMCGRTGEERAVTIVVATTQLTPPGTYVVSVSETGTDGQTVSWSFSVSDGDQTTTTEVVEASTTTTTSVTPTTAPAISSTTATTVVGLTTTTASSGPDPEAPSVEQQPDTSTTTVPTEVAGASTTTTTAGASEPPVIDGDREPEDVADTTTPTRPDGTGLSGVDSDDVLAIFTHQEQDGALDGVDQGFFDRLFGTSETQPIEFGARPSGWLWFSLFCAIAVISTAAGLVRRFRGPAGTANERPADE